MTAPGAEQMADALDRAAGGLTFYAKRLRTVEKITRRSALEAEGAMVAAGLRVREALELLAAADTDLERILTALQPGT